MYYKKVQRNLISSNKRVDPNLPPQFLTNDEACKNAWMTLNENFEKFKRVPTSSNIKQHQHNAQTDL
jgi:hypothetical protein